MAASRGPPFHADHVGSLLRPQPLKDAFRDVHSGRIDQNAFRTIQDGCIRDAVAMQHEAGLQSITDGEFRRGSWFLGFVEAVEGLGVTDAPFEFHDAAGGRAIPDRLCRRETQTRARHHHRRIRLREVADQADTEGHAANPEPGSLPRRRKDREPDGVSGSSTSSGPI